MLRIFLIFLLFAIPGCSENSTGAFKTIDQANWQLRAIKCERNYLLLEQKYNAQLKEIEAHIAEFVSHPLIKPKVDSVLISFLPKGTVIKNHFMRKLVK